MGDVVDIRPKTLNRTYKQQKFTVTYIPSTRKWCWCVEVVQVTKYSEEADTQIGAIRAAEKHIDKVKKLQGAA